MVPIVVFAALVSTPFQKKPAMQDVIQLFSADQDSIQKYYSVPLSAHGLDRYESFLLDWSKKSASLPFENYDVDGQVDLVLLKNYIRAELADIPTKRERFKSILTLMPFANGIISLEENRWELSNFDPETIAGKLDSMRIEAQALVDQLKDESKRKSVNPSLALKGAEELGKLIQTLKKWFDHYNGYKPIFSWWCQKPYDQLAAVLETYQKELKENVAMQKGQDDDPLVGEPIGAKRLANDLAREMLPYSPEELISIADKEYQWCLTQMKNSSQKLGFGDDWKKALDHTKADHVEPGMQDELIMAQGKEATEFVESHDLVTVEPLCKETWHVNMLNAQQQRNWPFAFYGGQHMATSYPLPEMDHATKQMSMRGNNKHFMRAVTYHELIPGHHLQIYMSSRYKNYRERFSTPFFVEGWALHWEMLMWDLNFAKSEEDKIGMLFWRMHRCARIVVSLKFHLGEMTPQQMVDYLIDKVGHERWTATSEVRRYVGDMYSPLYQCAYMIGGLQLRTLYKELVPRSMSSKQFHDAVLHLGAIPMETVRLSLLGKKFQPDFKIEKWLKSSYESGQ